MKKRERLIKKDNVILLPDLDKRLLEKGLEQLQQKKYHEAIQLFSEAQQLNPDNQDIYIGLALAYFELGNLPEAMLLAKEMLQIGIGDYFKIVDLYIMILVQQHQYEEIIATIEPLIEEKEVPADKLEHFMELLQFSRKMIEENQDTREEMPENQVNLGEIDLFSLQDLKDQVHFAANLANSNVRAIINEIAAYLTAADGQPFFKTMLLTVLKEQEYENELTVSKFGRELVVVPLELFELDMHPDYQPIYELVEKELENEDPVLLENLKQFMDRYFFLIYPFRVVYYSPTSWATAFHHICLSYLGMDKPLMELASKYGTNETEVSAVITLIGQIDEFSSP